jgi:DNA-binding response OmpR family regulator
VSRLRERPLVLVADDEEDIRVLVAMRLEQAGYEVAEALDGDQALRLAEELGPDLAVLDVMMPGLDGYQVAEGMQTSDRTRDIPVIMLTAMAGEEDAMRGFEVGAAEYMTKPFNLQRLTSRVQSVLRGSPPARV